MLSLNDKECKIVDENMGLVGTVIKRYVRNVNGLGIYTYQDIFQIGCIGLMQAVKKYVPGEVEFSTYACIAIRNEIYNALEYATVRRQGEVITDMETVLNLMPLYDEMSVLKTDLDCLLDAAKARATGVIAKGIDAIRLKAVGYSCRDIGELMGGFSANNVSAWISKARVFLKNDPDLMRYAA